MYITLQTEAEAKDRYHDSCCCNFQAIFGVLCLFLSEFNSCTAARQIQIEKIHVYALLKQLVCIWFTDDSHVIYELSKKEMRMKPSELTDPTCATPIVWSETVKCGVRSVVRPDVSRRVDWVHFVRLLQVLMGPHVLGECRRQSVVRNLFGSLR